ncbi:hypothetical protein [Bacillus niameyensis]|uniref:hypothetical protein n=1 Tax=Bacillus niameyensis TaxID=1522308 RepID=UPI000782926A|nr:hypothetical protein [Bacillus niameyensis]
MSTIKTLFEDAVQYEESLLAHHIFCLVQEGKISWHDPDSILSNIEPNFEKLESMHESNFLGLCPIKIFSLKLERGQWAFVYAKDPAEASQYVQRTVGKKPLNCHELSPDFEIYYGNRILNFRALKKEQTEFPCLIMYYEG